MELTITFTPDVKYKKAKFIIENLSISDTLGNSKSQWEDEISYDSIDLYLDDIKYDGNISTWAGNKLSVDDIFEQCLSAYIRNDTESYKSFSEDWKIFNKIDNFKEYQDDILIKMPIFTMGHLRIYELDLATPKNKYYYCDDHFLMLDSNGGIVTDMENYYAESMYDDICDIIEGNLKCLYKGENIDLLIKEYGGEKGFLSEFKN